MCKEKNNRGARDSVGLTSDYEGDLYSTYCFPGGKQSFFWNLYL